MGPCWGRQSFRKTSFQQEKESKPQPSPMMRPATEKSKDFCQTYLDCKRCEQLKWPWKRTRLARSGCTAGLRPYYKTIVNETAWHWLNTSKFHEFKSEPEHSHTQRCWLIFICVCSCVCRYMHVWVPRDQRLTSGMAPQAPDGFFLETQTYWLASEPRDPPLYLCLLNWNYKGHINTSGFLTWVLRTKFRSSWL